MATRLQGMRPSDLSVLPNGTPCRRGDHGGRRSSRHSTRARLLNLKIQTISALFLPDPACVEMIALHSIPRLDEWLPAEETAVAEVD